MASIEFPLINGVMYSWASIKIGMLGAPVIGYTAIEYGETDDKENLYGQGRFPIGRSYGNVEPNASITLYKDTIQAFQKIAPFGRIADIPPFDVSVFYVNKAGKFVRDVLKNFEFTENKVSSSQGDKGISMQIGAIISHVEWGK